ncbi:glutaredoxin 2 [Simiduia agarivorans SA1 = DSM 21679]|uniref:Glutaredoxin 2 n=1 Tax=Simiduia agarivorans (strain DSM 21679 / JCM 13881 / BCRC 17597 / SA1) TaxID=1117647 RepID=K4KGW1_SIMAS|nr:glutaredoxin 2 [Simiduia agarivorans SA1 = DSM 21679]
MGLNVRVELLGTAGCHLCDVAESLIYHCIETDASGVLRQHCTVDIIDIADDQVLMERFATSIPVLRTSSGESWCWPFPEPAELQADLLALVGAVSQTP